VKTCDSPTYPANRINFDMKSKMGIRYWINRIKCVLTHFILGCVVKICNGESLPFNPLLLIKLLCGAHFWIKRAESRFQPATQVESYVYLQLLQEKLIRHFKRRLCLKKHKSSRSKSQLTLLKQIINIYLHTEKKPITTKYRVSEGHRKRYFQ